MARGIVQPALIIGTGGSGVEVVRRFKRRFREIYPETPYVQLLGIDTAPQEQELPDVPLLDEDEWLYAADFNMDFFVGENYIVRHPEIRDWWREYQGLGLRHIKAGAGMRRPVGRLALYVHFDKLVDRIRAQVKEIFQSEVFNELPQQYRRSINVYIVSSTCGGTGTGMFLDLAYVVRHVVGDVMPGINVRSRGLFFLPSVFLGTGQVKRTDAVGLNANAHGAITELDYAMSREARLGPVAYPGLPNVHRGDRPFQTVYLTGNQTAAGALYTDFHQLLERASVHIQIELASPLSEKGDARMDNVLSSIQSKPPVEGKERSYSSFADDWIELPSARLHVRWTKALASELLTRLDGSKDESADSLGKKAFKELTSSDGYGRLRGLRGAGGLNPFLPNVGSEMDYFTDVGSEGRDNADLIRRAQQMQTVAMRQLQDNSELERSIEQAAGLAASEIQDTAKGVLKNGSLHDVTVLLGNVNEELRKWLAAARTEATSDAADRWVKEFARSIEESKPGMLSKRRHVEQQRQLVIDASERARAGWQDWLRARSAGLIQDRVPRLLHTVAELREVVSRLQGSIRAAEVLVRDQPEPALPPGMETGAISDDEIDTALETGDREERLILEASRGLPSLLDLSPVTVNRIAEVVWAESQKAVRLQAPEFLRTLEIPEQEIAKRLERLSPLAVYRADWQANPQSRDSAFLRILGLPQTSEERASAIKSLMNSDTARDTETAIHMDANRVVMTVQHHGFPLFALAESDDTEEAFQGMNGIEKNLCFVLPESEVRNWSYKPVVGTEAKKYFCVALALDLITKKGPRFVLNLGRANSQDVVLGEGATADEALQNAIDGFIKGGHASQVQLRLRELENEDTETLYEQVSNWVSPQRVRIAAGEKLPANLHECIDRADDYGKSIKPL